MIQVGINQNVYISKIEKTDKGALAISFSDQEDLGASNPFAALSGGNEIVDTGLDSRLLIFPPLPSKKDDWTEDKKREMVSMDLQDTKNQLIHIMDQYMTKDKQPKLDMFRNTGIETADDYNAMILDTTVLEKIFSNLADDFIEAMQPYVGQSSLRMRLKLLRQSKEKHFATLPKKFLKENPFLESMDIPWDEDPKKSQSKVKFSNWEITQGLNDGTPVSKDSADKKEEAAPADPSSVFGQR